MRKLTTEVYILLAEKQHNHFYDYSETVYTKSHDKVCVICSIHGKFYVRACDHINLGRGCPKCNGGVSLSREEFFEKAKKIHGDKYDYSKVVYVNAHTKVCIICPKHGEFWIMPYLHLQGQGCRHCKSSKLENIVERKLINENILFETQYKFKELGKQTIDFYLADYKICIECQGEQHFIPISFNSLKQDDECYDEFKKRLLYDEMKYNFCKDNNIEMIYFTFPKLFHRKDTDINLTFYKDKNLFISLSQMLNFIKSKNIN